MNDIQNIIFYSTFAGLSTIAGSYLVIKFEAWTKKNLIFMISFATGVLLSAAFLDIMPEAQKISPNTLAYVLVSILALYILEQRIIIHSCHDEECETHHAKGTISVLGLGLHSLIDGLVIAAGFSVSAPLGILASLGIIFHEIPEGASIYSILIYTGYKKKKALLYSAIVAITTPLGAIISLLVLKNIGEQHLGIWLSLAAGSIIYIGASDLIPETHEKAHKLNIFFVLLGVVLIYLVTKFFVI